MSSFEIRSHAGSTTAVLYSATPPKIGARLILAHGAGAPQTHPFMVTFGRELARRGLDVVTFNFYYMESGRRAPDPAAKLEACWRSVIDDVRQRKDIGKNKLFIGGKSMGGRMVAHIAAAGDDTAAEITGVILLGYPLHPPGKPEQLRAAHQKSPHRCYLSKARAMSLGLPTSCGRSSAKFQPQRHYTWSKAAIIPFQSRRKQGRRRMKCSARFSIALLSGLLKATTPGCLSLGFVVRARIRTLG